MIVTSTHASPPNPNPVNQPTRTQSDRPTNACTLQVGERLSRFFERKTKSQPLEEYSQELDFLFHPSEWLEWFPLQEMDDQQQLKTWKLRDILHKFETIESPLVSEKAGEKINRILISHPDTVLDLMECYAAFDRVDDLKALVQRLPEDFQLPEDYLLSPEPPQPGVKGYMPTLREKLKAIRDHIGVALGILSPPPVLQPTTIEGFVDLLTPKEAFPSFVAHRPYCKIIYLGRYVPDAPRYNDTPATSIDILNKKYYLRGDAGLHMLDLHTLLQEPIPQGSQEELFQIYMMGERGKNAWCQLKKAYQNFGMTKELAHGNRLMQAYMNHQGALKNREAFAREQQQITHAKKIRETNISEFKRLNGEGSPGYVFIERQFGTPFVKLVNTSDKPIIFYSRWSDVSSLKPNEMMFDSIGLPFTRNAMTIRPRAAVDLDYGDLLTKDSSGNHFAEGFFGLPPVDRRAAMVGIVTRGLAELTNSVEHSPLNTTILVKVPKSAVKNKLGISKGQSVEELLKLFVLVVKDNENGTSEDFWLRHDWDALAALSDNGADYDLKLAFRHEGKLLGADCTIDLIHESERTTPAVEPTFRKFLEK